MKLEFLCGLCNRVSPNGKSIGEGRAILLIISEENQPKQKTFSIF